MHRGSLLKGSLGLLLKLGLTAGQEQPQVGEPNELLVTGPDGEVATFRPSTQTEVTVRTSIVIQTLTTVVTARAGEVGWVRVGSDFQESIVVPSTAPAPGDSPSKTTSPASSISDVPRGDSASTQSSTTAQDSGSTELQNTRTDSASASTTSSEPTAPILVVVTGSSGLVVTYSPTTYPELATATETVTRRGSKGEEIIVDPDDDGGAWVPILKGPLPGGPLPPPPDWPPQDRELTSAEPNSGTTSVEITSSTSESSSETSSESCTFTCTETVSWTTTVSGSTISTTFNACTAAATCEHTSTTATTIKPSETPDAEEEDLAGDDFRIPFEEVSQKQQGSFLSNLENMGLYGVGRGWELEFATCLPLKKEDKSGVMIDVSPDCIEGAYKQFCDTLGEKNWPAGYMSVINGRNVKPTRRRRRRDQHLRYSASSILGRRAVNSCANFNFNFEYDSFESDKDKKCTESFESMVESCFADDRVVSQASFGLGKGAYKWTIEKVRDVKDKPEGGGSNGESGGGGGGGSASTSTSQPPPPPQSSTQPPQSPTTQPSSPQCKQGLSRRIDLNGNGGIDFRPHHGCD